MLIADGGGGGSFADVMNLGAIQGVTAETQKLVDAAKGGGFKITPEGVKPIRDALTELVNGLADVQYKSYLLDQNPQLGDHPYGHTVAKHDSTAAGKATQVLEQLKQVAKQADEALARAAGLYKEAENQAFSALQTKQA
ncbi:hypothetical protein ABZ342_36590 [Amycolatopsis sp. NPDC005961]|uniref:Uncharacterized protein n=1 Tax=Amycolatopsis camponoti TaxID=2606593 RepID=A0A6I8M228_9PSEU|nr:hypothetical protein [Amycolatopsis camponoti]VVJ23735.1 Uncharacterised protein [Amycolatopsis camponoti]